MFGTKEQNEGYDSIISANNPYASQTLVQLRLDTSKLLEDIELFLSAQKPVLKKDSEGNYREEYKQVGEPLVNEEGRVCLLNTIRMSLMNEHIVQGNLKHEEYQTLMVNTRKELADAIVLNCYEWGIKDNKLNFIIDNLMRFFKLFISRTINNEERKSYMQQFKEVFNRSSSNKSGILNGLKNFSGNKQQNEMY